MVWPAVELGLSRARLAHQNAAVVQTCVPLVALKGDSYRLRGKDLGVRPAGETAEIG
ncbi:MAG: hypothetical protein LC790_02610 [Actinobacteria bacterium]|nr:hypothetical protein [Actinomycetota bacterium]MCA1697839.1 hypothetical protein [Actinomycetota bacterium]